ncbi:hypothetical protein JKP88DRAFT_279239 [Tribonema minus]|uniref:SAM-dependent methyltransferase TRM5/TYW2-type domain-containing protein n=1 Tax=Tribonema minus TaxID=303371 RepID=A0A835YSH8_9STRA|nr:hypothetical protein JKP88DRAFT_279239 [Tribonema minus]
MSTQTKSSLQWSELAALPATAVTAAMVAVAVALVAAMVAAATTAAAPVTAAMVAVALAMAAVAAAMTVAAAAAAAATAAVAMSAAAAVPQLLKVALAAGFRESGIVTGARGRVIVAIRTTSTALQVPLVHCGRVIMPSAAMVTIVQVANARFADNLRHTNRLHAALVEHFASSSAATTAAAAAAAVQAPTSAAATAAAGAVAASGAASNASSLSKPAWVNITWSKLTAAHGSESIERWGHAVVSAVPTAVTPGRLMLFGGYGRCSSGGTHAATVRRLGDLLEGAVMRSDGSSSCSSGDGSGSGGGQRQQHRQRRRLQQHISWRAVHAPPPPQQQQHAAPAAQQAAPAMPQAREGHTLLYLPTPGVQEEGGFLCLYGGRTSPCEALSDVWLFCLRTCQWHCVEPRGGGALPGGRWGHTATILPTSTPDSSSSTSAESIAGGHGGSALIAGGRDANSVLSDCWTLIWTAERGCGWPALRWRQAAPLPAPLFHHAACVLHLPDPHIESTATDDGAGWVLAVTGGLPDLADTIGAREVYVLDGTTSKWKFATLAPQGRFAHACAALPTHPALLLMLGGSGGAPSRQALAEGGQAAQRRGGTLAAHATRAAWTWLEVLEDGDNEAGLQPHLAVCEAPDDSGALLTVGGGAHVGMFGPAFASSWRIYVEVEVEADEEKAARGAPLGQPSRVSDVSAELSGDAAEPQACFIAPPHLVKALKVVLEGAGLLDKTKGIVPYQEGGDDGGDVRGNLRALPLQPTPQALDAALALPAVAALVANGEVRAGAHGCPASKVALSSRRATLRSALQSLLLRSDVPPLRAAALSEAALNIPLELLGDVVLAPHGALSEPEWQRSAEEAWGAVAASFRASRVAMKAEVDAGPMRESHATVVMFCTGNITEKLRVARLPARGETIVDLYAGIGYYALPYLAHAGAARVHACEWNPQSVAALRANVAALSAAAAERCTIHHGDNRDPALRRALSGVADRVNLGLLPSSEDGWPVAAAVLRSTGGWCHVHGNYRDGEGVVWGEAVAEAFRALLQEVKGGAWRVDCRHVERVKSYAPRVAHFVADIECRPASAPALQLSAPE